jgi:proteic killer suppression protein
MICSFGSKGTRKIWNGKKIKSIPMQFQLAGRRKLRMLNNSNDINDLTVPPLNRLEKLSGAYLEFHSIWINDQWRIIFKKVGNDAEMVEIIDVD